MDQQIAVESVDDLLRPFLYAGDESEAEQLLSHLIRKHAEPIINSIIKSKLRVSLNNSEGSRQNQDALEIAGDVCALILSDLRNLKNDLHRRTIGNFHNYVAVKTYSACADYFRAKNPQRWRLKDLLRYHLKQGSRFALWESEDKRWLCGLESWREEKRHLSYSDRLQQLMNDPPSLFNAAESPIVSARRMTPADLLSIIFERVGHPIDFNHLVTLVANVWGIKDQPTESYDRDDDGSSVRGSLIDPSASVETVVEQRLYLQRLWIEVSQLPLLQRSVLLLNLRDAQGGSPIAFIPHLGIASKAEIAELLAIPAEQFSELWNDLPLDDARIAQLVGVTRQQVINLRKTARERLTRRMKALEKQSGSNKKEEHTV